MTAQAGQPAGEQNEAPLVSVVIPCYNQAHFLRDAVQSCLNQTYSKLEVIVVNDGSTDETSVLAHSFGAPVRVVDQPNTGLSGARNAGIRAAKGTIIALLDADDRMLPDCIEARVALLLESENRGAAIGAWWQMDVDGNQTRAFGTAARQNPELGPREYIRGSVAPTCGAVFRKSAFVKCGLYDPFLRSYEDWDLLIRVNLKWKIVYDEIPRSEYRQVSGSMSRNFIRMHDNLTTLILKNRAYFDSGWQYWQDTTIAKWYCIIGLASQIYNENKFSETVKKLAIYAVRRPTAIPYLFGYAVFVAPGRFLKKRQREN